MAEPAALASYLGLGAALRAAGVIVGTGQQLTFARALAATGTADVTDVYWSGRACLVSRYADIATFDRVRTGREVIPPDPGLSHAANLLWMLHGQEPPPEDADVLDTTFVLYISKDGPALMHAGTGAWLWRADSLKGKKPPAPGKAANSSCGCR